CPWLDLTADLEGPWPAAPREPLLGPGVLSSWAGAYAAQAAAAEPTISPLLGDLSDLPAIILQSAGDDILAPDADRLQTAVEAAGGEIEHRRHEGWWHDFQVMGELLGEADEALADLGARVSARLAPQRPQRAVSTS